MKTVTTTTQSHLVTTRVYDDQTLRLVSVMTAPKPGWQCNGHREDCRCETCRPDIMRLSS